MKEIPISRSEREMIIDLLDPWTKTIRVVAGNFTLMEGQWIARSRKFMRITIGGLGCRCFVRRPVSNALEIVWAKLRRGDSGLRV